MKLLSSANRPYLLAALVLLLVFGGLQAAEWAWSRFSPPAAVNEDRSPPPDEPPQPIRPVVVVGDDRLTIDVDGHRTSIGLGETDKPALEWLEACLNERLALAFADGATDGLSRESGLPLLQGLRERKRIREPVNQVVMSCVQEMPRRR